MMNNSAIIPANTMERDTMQIGNEEVLTLTQAAERLGLSRHTLGTQTRKGVLSAWLMGGIFFVTATEVERYRREHLGKPGPKRKARAPQWFTWTMLAGGEEQSITWTDGVLTGDAELIGVFLEAAKHIPGTIDPWPYSTGQGWRADPMVAQWVLGRIGPLIHAKTNIRKPRGVRGRIY